MKTVLRALLVGLLCVACSVSASDLWLTSGKELLRVDADQKMAHWVGPVTQGSRVLAARDETAWIVESELIRLIDHEGNSVQQFALTSEPTAFVVDAAQGALHLAMQDKVLSFFPNGATRSLAAPFENARALATADGENFWVLNSDTVRRYESSEGWQRLPLAKELPIDRLVGLTIDPVRKVLWLVGDHFVYRLREDSEEITAFQVPGEGIISHAFDTEHNVLWLVTSSKLFALDRDGNRKSLEHGLDLPDNSPQLIFDGERERLWLVAPGLARAWTKGNPNTLDFDLYATAQSASARTLLIEPMLTLLNIDNGGSDLALALRCGDRPCDLQGGVPRELRLRVRIDDGTPQDLPLNEATATAKLEAGLFAQIGEHRVEAWLEGSWLPATARIIEWVELGPDARLRKLAGKATNAPPTVSITAPANNALFLAPATLTMTASASDSDGTISKVEFYRGSTLLGSKTTSPYTYTWSNVVKGSYSLTAKATDNKGASTTSAAVNIVVNQAPTVSLTAPANNAAFNAGANVTLTASASDADGTIAKVEFYQGTTLLGSKTSSPYTYTWASVPAGSYVLTAKATDNRGAVTTSSAVNIKVNAVAAPSVSVTAPADGSTVLATASVVIKATAKSTGSTIASIDFYDGTNLLGTVKGTTASLSGQITKSGFAAGTHSLTATATDALGQKANSAAVKLNVQPVGPVVQLTAPLDGALLGRGSTIDIEATASSNQGSIVSVDFFDGATPITHFDGPPYGLYWYDAAVGAHTLAAKATDSKGATAVSAPVNITVSNSMAPNIYLSVTGEAYHVPATLTLTADASDPDGTVAKVEFFEGTRLLATATQAPYSFVWSGVPAGTYSLFARATDDAGVATTTDPAQIVVDATVPTIAITSPSPGATVWLGDSGLEVKGTVNGPTGTNVAVVVGGREMMAQVTGQNFSASSWMAENSDALVTAQAQTPAGAKAQTQVKFKAIAPHVWITDPEDNSEVFTDRVNIRGFWQAPSVDSITVAGQAARVVGNEFALDAMPLNLGDNIIVVSMAYSMPDGSKKTLDYSRIVKRLAPVVRSIAIDSTQTFDARLVGGLPMVADGYLFAYITGPVTGGPDTQVLVDNGRDSRVVATVTNGRFSAPIAIPPGENTVTATAIGPSGSPVSASKIVFGNIPSGQTGALLRISAPAPCTAYPTAPATISLKTEIIALSANPILSVEFSAAEVGVIGTSNTAPYSFEWKYVPVGVYHVRARAQSFGGQISDSPALTIGVGHGISCQLVEPGAGLVTAYATPADINLNASVSVFGSTVDKVEFFRDSNQLLATVTDKPYAYTWRNVPPGSYQLTARATAKSGDSASSSASVTVGDLSVILQVRDLDFGRPLDQLGAPATLEPRPYPSLALSALERVDFYANGRLVRRAPAPDLVANWTGVPPGDYSIIARAVARNGTTADSKPVTVHVGPLAVKLDLYYPETYKEPATVHLHAVARVWDGAVSHVEFYADGRLIGDVTGAWEADFSWSKVSGGRYQMTAKAYDTHGNSGESLPLAVTVIGMPTIKITAPAEGSSFGTGGSLTVAVEAATPQSSVRYIDYMEDGNLLFRATSPPPFTYTLAGLTQGDHTLTAAVTNNESMTATSAPIHIHLTDTPAASITAPTDGQMIANGQPVNISVQVSMPKKTIDHVDILADGNVLTTVAAPGGSQFTANFAWANASVGTHAITATAYAKDGSKVDPPAVRVTMVGPLKVRLDSPHPLMTILSSDIFHLRAHVSEDSGTIAAVGFYAGDTLLATVTAEPYVFAWKNPPVGIHQLTARAIDQIGQVMVSATVAVRAIEEPVIELDDGIDGTAVEDEHIAVTGRAVVPSNSVLFVGGQLATITLADRFFVNDVHLQAGTNTIPVQLNSDITKKSVQALVVTSLKPAPFEVRVDRSEGLAPLSTNLIITNVGKIPFLRIDIYYDGNGHCNGAGDDTIESLDGDQVVIPRLYDKPGTYTIVACVTGLDLKTSYQAKLTIEVQDPVLAALRASSMYESFLGRLRGGTTDDAAQMIAQSIREPYRAAFEKLGSRLVDKVDTLGTVHSVVVSDDYLILKIHRGTYEYEVTLMPDEDGIKRIVSF